MQTATYLVTLFVFQLGTPSSLNHIRKFVEVISSHTKQKILSLTAGTLQGPYKEGLVMGSAV